LIEITKDNFSEEVSNKSGFMLLDFWAEWCMPCKMMKPALEEIEKEYKDQIQIGMINIEEQNELAKSYSVQAVPTIILLKDGEIKKTLVGLKQKNDLEAIITKELEN
jgi:thioredoxin 1